MPKRTEKPDPRSQKERFEKAVQELIDAGELSLIDAEERLDKLVRAKRFGKG